MSKSDKEFRYYKCEIGELCGQEKDFHDDTVCKLAQVHEQYWRSGNHIQTLEAKVKELEDELAFTKCGRDKKVHGLKAKIKNATWLFKSILSEGVDDCIKTYIKNWLKEDGDKS